MFSNNIGSEECSTRLEIKDKENREFDEFIATLLDKQ
jgi:hypothetical protein